MKKKTRKVVFRIVAAVAALAVLFYVGLQLVSWIYNPIVTERAMTYQVEDTLTAQGLLLREETLVRHSGGALDFQVADGAKIAKGGTIANIYSTSEQVAAQQELREVEAEIEKLTNLSNSGDYYLLDLTQIQNQIAEQLYALADIDGQTGAADSASVTAQLNDLIIRKQVAVGEQVDLSARITALQAERDALLSQGGQKTGSIQAETSGYFFSGSDGYETVVDVSSIAAMTVEQFRAITPTTPDASAVGKISSGYTWYYVFETDASTAQRLSGVQENGTLRGRFAFMDADTFPMQIVAANQSGDRVLMVLSSDYLSGQLAAMRTSELQLVLGTYEGLRVDQQAVRIVDGETGVYILSGGRARFRRLDVLYTKETYVIVQAGSSGSGYLQLYDNVIVRGGDLYDGRVLE